MASRPLAPDAPTNSAALSLLELRRHLLRRAGALSARARGMRNKGAAATATRLEEKSEHLLAVARTMAENKNN